MSSDADLQNEAAPDEETISPAMRRGLQECFDRGSKITDGEKPDRDYANTMFTQCVVKDPGNLVYVETFLTNLQEKYQNNKKGARVKGFGGRGPLKKATTQKNWSEILKIGPGLLKSNPWDVPVLRAMAQACEELGYNEAELRYLKNALDANPNDIETNKHCGRSLARMGQFDQAIACWHRVETKKPKDKEATKMISMLTEDKTRVAAGLAPKSVELKNRPRRGTPAPEDSAASTDSAAGDESGEASSARREITLTPRQILERALADDPTDIPSYLKLADLLQGEGRHADVERTLTKALAASGNDLRVQERLEDAGIARQKQQLAVAEKKAAVESTEQSLDLAKRMRQELNRREIAVFGARVERYPEEYTLKFELGIRLKRDGNYREAAKYFMEARENAEFKLGATLELGECLQHQKNFSKALNCYTRAIQLAENGTEQQKLALYRAGVLATGLKDLENAAKYLEKLGEIDANYKDLPSRLDKIDKIRNKG